MKLEGADFHIEIESSVPKVTRNLTYSNGDSISFTISIADAGNLTFSQIHHASVRQVISLLEDWIKPQ